MTNEEYHSNTTHISKSGLDQIRKSPAHYWDKYLNPDRPANNPTEAMIFGTAVHSAILEPDSFRDNYAFIDDTEKFLELKSKGVKSPRQTNAYKEWLAGEQMENAGKLIISQDDFNDILKIRDKALSNHIVKKLLSNGIAEQSFFFNDEMTGAPCKARPDWYSNVGFIMDIKTTEDASKDGFARSVMKYRYHVQAPFYLDAMRACGGEPRGFTFVAIEKTRPFNMSILTVPAEILAFGRRVYREDLSIYTACLEAGEWPGYPDNAEELILPPWIKY